MLHDGPDSIMAECKILKGMSAVVSDVMSVCKCTKNYT